VITSRDNERLKLVRKLHDRRWRDKLGLFAVEGEDLLEAGLAAGLEPADALWAAGSGGGKAATTRPEVPAFGGRSDDVEPELLAEVSTLAHPPRVVAVFRRDDLPRGTRPVTLALWHVGDPGNVGTLLRAADAFGAAVALSEGCADPTGPKAVRASMGSLFRVPLSGFDEPAGKRVALVASGGIPLPELDSGGEVVLALGAEREGLPAEVLGRCEERVSIPQPGGGESLNVAMAGAIALYELAREGR
jgi:TrmH family RNA methyltransferase